MIAEAIAFYTENKENYLACLTEHLEICLVCMVVCLVLGIALGYLSAKKEHVATPIITAINALCTIPVIAMFMLLIPVFGLGVVPAVLVISLHSVLTVVVNTMAGIQNVPQSVIESAQGMGFTARQICFRVEFPLAMPLILAGVRTAVVGIIAGATLAAHKCRRAGRAGAQRNQCNELWGAAFGRRHHCVYCAGV